MISSCSSSRRPQRQRWKHEPPRSSRKIPPKTNNGSFPSAACIIATHTRSVSLPFCCCEIDTKKKVEKQSNRNTLLIQSIDSLRIKFETQTFPVDVFRSLRLCASVIWFLLALCAQALVCIVPPLACVVISPWVLTR